MAAVQAAAPPVKHLIWSTLPDSEKLTGGRVKVAHFTERPASTRQSSDRCRSRHRPRAAACPFRVAKQLWNLRYIQK